MLVDVDNDNRFQAYLDEQEGKLFRALVPILVTGIRLQVNYNQVQAGNYIVERGQPLLLATYRRIYLDQWSALGDKDQKAIQPRLLYMRDIPARAPSRRNRFIDRQQIYLQRRAATQVRNISASQAHDIAGRILAAAAEGTPNREIAQTLIDEAMDIGKQRALVIARTEIHSSAMAAVAAGMEDRDIQPKTKTWWTAGDDRVRPSHAALHGEEVDYDDTFGNGLAFPGDPNGDADEVINCRCSCLYSTED